MLGKFKYPAVPSSSTPEYCADPLPVSELKKMHIKALLLLVALIKKQAFYFLYSCHRDLKGWEQFLSGKSSKAFENMKDEMKTIQEKKHISEIDESIIRKVEMISWDLIDLESHCEKSSSIIDRQVMKKIEQIQEEIFGLTGTYYHRFYSGLFHHYHHLWYKIFPDYIEDMRKEFLYKIEHKLLTITSSRPEKMESENSLIRAITYNAMSNNEDPERVMMMMMDMHWMIKSRRKGKGSQIDTSTIFDYQQDLIEVLHTVATEQALTILICLTTSPHSLSEKESFEIAESLMELAEVVDKYIMMTQ